MVQFVRGVRDVERGFAVLRAHPRLWKYVLAPAAVTLALFAALIVSVVMWLGPFIGRSTSELPWWLGGSVTSAVLSTVLTVALSGAAAFVFVGVVGLLTGPFSEKLSEQVEVALTGQAPPATTLLELVGGLFWGAVHAARRLIVALLGFVAVLLIGLVPVIGSLLAIALAAWLTANATAYDCYDAVLARRSLRYRDKLRYLVRHRQRALGLGAAVGGLLLVPGVNLIALGLGAAGATTAALAEEGKLAASAGG